MPYNPAEVLRELIEELDDLEEIPVSGSTMTRARQVIAHHTWNAARAWGAQVAELRTRLAPFVDPMREVGRDETGAPTVHVEVFVSELEDAVDTLEAMDLHIDNPLYERLRKILEA